MKSTFAEKYIQRKFITVCTLALAFTGCEKEALKPRSANGIRHEPVSRETPATKMAKTKDNRFCYVMYNDRKVGTGQSCSLKGDTCGRNADCILTGPLRNSYSTVYQDDNDVFHGMTYTEFVARWNTEDGRKQLMSEGFYETFD